MQISESDEELFYIIEIFGDVDAASSIILDKSIEKAVTQGKKNILVDCTNLHYISSAGLGVFMSYLQDFQEKDIFLAIFGLSEKVRNIFEILGLDKLILIVESKEEARLLKNDSLL